MFNDNCHNNNFRLLLYDNAKVNFISYISNSILCKCQNSTMQVYYANFIDNFIIYKKRLILDQLSNLNNICKISFLIIIFTGQSIYQIC